VARKVVALAGGVGAARYLAGVVRAVVPEDLCVIVNTGDDRDFFGLRVCPDLDIVTYALAGIVDRERGWGYAGESFAMLERLRVLRDDVWFNLGDRDLATHVHRSERLRAGRTLCEVTAEIATRLGVGVTLLTNAAGGVREDLQVGDLVRIRSHLDLQGPITSVPAPESPYDAALTGLVGRVQEGLGLRPLQGRYAAVLGPQYETPAEIRFLRALGADLVGMSTAPEARAAAEAGR